MTIFDVVLIDYGIPHDGKERFGKYCDLGVLLSLASDHAPEYHGTVPGAYQGVLDFFTQRFGADNDFVRRLHAEFSHKTNRN